MITDKQEGFLAIDAHNRHIYYKLITTARFQPSHNQRRNRHETNWRYGNIDACVTLQGAAGVGVGSAVNKLNSDIAMIAAVRQIHESMAADRSRERRLV